MALSPSQLQARILLSAEDMRAISVEISQGFAPRRFRTGAVRTRVSGFAPQELLDISQQISREFAPRADSPRPAELVALAVDPRHLHVFWQLDEPGRIAAEPVDAAPQPLTLRVFSEAVERKPSQPAAASQAPADFAPVWFDVPVETSSGQQQITLPEDDACVAGMYRVAIGRLSEHQEFAALACSNTAYTPPQPSLAKESLPPAMAQFIMQRSQASSALAVNASGQQN